MKILIAGYYTPPIHALEILFAQGYKPSDVALLTYDDARNQPLLAFARAHGIETRTFHVKSRACLDWVKARGFDTLLSLYYRHIIPASILDLFPGRAVNLHAGLLPQYAGCWSSPWAIINGEDHSGFTWHYMTPDIDAGNILRHARIVIWDTDTAYSLYHRVLLSGIYQLVDVLELIDRGDPGVEQYGERRYYSRSLPHHGYIQPGWTDEQVERFIRAMYFPPFTGALWRDPQGSDHEILTMVQYKEITCRIF